MKSGFEGCVSELRLDGRDVDILRDGSSIIREKFKNDINAGCSGFLL